MDKQRRNVDARVARARSHLAVLMRGSNPDPQAVELARLALDQANAAADLRKGLQLADRAQERLTALMPGGGRHAT